MSDYVAFIQDGLCGGDAYCSWDSDSDKIDGVYEGYSFFSSVYVEGGDFFFREGFSDRRLRSDRVGGFVVFFGDYVCYVHGSRENLLKVVSVFGELRDSGELKEVVLACCEVAGL